MPIGETLPWELSLLKFYPAGMNMRYDANFLNKIEILAYNYQNI
jgi:hypothetical protein